MNLVLAVGALMGVAGWPSADAQRRKLKATEGVVHIRVDVQPLAGRDESNAQPVNQGSDVPS